MPQFGFQGFTEGSSVALSAAQGENSASSSVATWGQGSMASLEILQVHSNELVAPSGIWFEAVNIAGFDVPAGPGPGETYDPSFHEVTFIWEFDDPGSFSAPLNIPTSWNNRNVAYGKKAAHVFRDPGTYTVRLWAIDRSGTTAEATATITIADPDVVYTGTRTICYAADGNFSGAPVGCLQVTSDTAIRSALGAMTQTGRVLFKRGETATVTVEIPPAASQNARFGAWGSGADPILYPPQGGRVFSLHADASAEDYCFYDLDLRGRWDPTREAGDPRDQAFYWLFRDVPGDPVFVVHNCRIDGFGFQGAALIKDEIASTFIFNDCHRTNWQSYGFYGHGMNNPGCRVAFVGCVIAQNPDACIGTLGRQSFGNSQGAMRIETARNTVISVCDFFSTSGWSTSGVSGMPAVQGGMRIHTSAGPDPKFVADRIVLENGYNLIGSIESNSTTSVPGNFLFDRMLMVGGPHTTAFVNWSYGGTTFRNTLGIMPLVKRFGNAVFSCFSFSVPNPGTGTLQAPQAIYASTVLNLQSAANNSNQNMAFETGIDLFNTFTVENNVYHAPVQTTPDTSDAPLSMDAIAGFTPRQIGVRSSTETPTVTLSTAVGPGQSFSLAYPVVFDHTSSFTTGPSDFTPNDDHAIRVGQYDYFFQSLNEISLSFGSSDITITNLSQDTWAAGDEVLINVVRQNFSTDTSFASPGSIPLGRPLAGSAAIGDGGLGWNTETDMFEQDRQALPSRGALKP